MGTALQGDPWLVPSLQEQTGKGVLIIKAAQKVAPCSRNALVGSARQVRLGTAGCWPDVASGHGAPEAAGAMGETRRWLWTGVGPSVAARG